MTKSHENDNNDSDFKSACIITVFLLIKLLYSLIHLLNYLFKSIQALAVLVDFINLIAVSSSITCCLLNLLSKSTFSQHQKTQHKYNCLFMQNSKINL